MRVLDRYVLRSFLGAVAGALGAFLAVTIVVDVFERLDTFLDHHVSLALVIQYYVATVPFLVSVVLPIAALLGVLFSLGGMARRSELVAMTAAGVSLYRALAPLLLAGTMLAGVGLVFTMELAPRGTRLANETWDHEIKERPRRGGSTRRDLNYLGAGGRIFLIRRYDGARGRMDDVVVQQFAANTLVQRVDAKTATWQGGHWVFHDGYLRHFREDGPPEVEAFKDRVFDEIRETPKDFLEVVGEPDEMTLGELRDQARRTASSGGDVTRFAVDEHGRWSFPFASFVVILLGAPLTGAIRRGGHALGFGLALLIGFGYYIVLRIGQTYGLNGTMPPWVAAWLPNAVFLVAGAIGFWKTRK
ncbi:MAG: LPS export ABC transporter permease LptG [bacterium]